MDDPKVMRIISELRKVGLTNPRPHMSIIKALAKYLHSTESIGGVVYGRYGSGTGFAWLVATDKRIILIDKKPLFETVDELTYDIISGIKFTRAGFYGTVILHTRIGDYSIKFINRRCAKIFFQYIETRRMEA